MDDTNVQNDTVVTSPATSTETGTEAIASSTPQSNNTATSLEAQLAEAFNRGAAHYETNKSFTGFDFSDADVQNSEASADDSSEDSSNVNDSSDVSTESTETQEQPQTPSGISAINPEPSTTQTPSEDYKELYLNTLREKEAQVNLYATRLAALSEQYQSLKENSKASESTSSNTPDADRTIVDNASPAVRELFETFPEIAQAVQEMIDAKTRSVETTLQEQVNPIKMTLQQQYAEQFRNKITAAHPDVQDIIKSRSLEKWVDTLDPVAKAGADTIMKYGNADELISLLNMYKSGSTAATNNVPMSKGTPALVNKVMAAMAVPNTNKTERLTQEVTPVYRTESEAFDALVKEYESKLRK